MNYCRRQFSFILKKYRFSFHSRNQAQDFGFLFGFGLGFLGFGFFSDLRYKKHSGFLKFGFGFDSGFSGFSGLVGFFRVFQVSDFLNLRYKNYQNFYLFSVRVFQIGFGFGFRCHSNNCGGWKYFCYPFLLFCFHYR